MKKLTYLLPLLLLTGLGRVTPAQTPQATHSTAKPAHVEYMVMKNGKMMMQQGGKMQPMTMDMTMSDGSICMADGTCKRTDGTTTKMKEGDHCMIKDGKMMIHPGSTKKSMKAGAKMKDMNR